MCLDICGAFEIILLSIRRIVLGAVQFDSQFCGGAIKVKDEAAAGYLSAEAVWIIVKVFVP